MVGGVGGLALIGGIVFWLLRRGQTASSKLTSGTYDLSYEKPVISAMDTGNTGTAFVSTPTPKLYVRFPINYALTNNLCFSRTPMTPLLSPHMQLKTIQEQRTLYLHPSNPSILICLTSLEAHSCLSGLVAILNIPVLQSSKATLGSL